MAFSRRCCDTARRTEDKHDFAEAACAGRFASRSTRCWRSPIATAFTAASSAAPRSPPMPMSPRTSSASLSGEDMMAEFESSPGSRRKRCRVCGCPAPGKAPISPTVSIPAGLLDDDPGVRPVLHVFASSKASWWAIADDLPRHEKWVPGYEPSDISCDALFAGQRSRPSGKSRHGSSRPRHRFRLAGHPADRAARARSRRLLRDRALTTRRKRRSPRKSRAPSSSPAARPA